jgi:hypothetical protein
MVKKIMKKTSDRFAPWVGSRYSEGIGSLRILLVCESHYGAKKNERPSVTPEIVKALALEEQHPLATRKLRRHPHFTKIMTAVMNVKRRFDRAEKREFWNRVAYYHFLQKFISGPRVLPSEEAWERGKIAFAEVLDVLVPNLIICLSKRTGFLVRSLARGVPVAVVNHPSSRFAYSKVNPIIGQHKEQALAQKAHAPVLAGSDAFTRWSQATASATPTPGPHLLESDRTTLHAQRRKAMAMLDESLLP